MEIQKLDRLSSQLKNYSNDSAIDKKVAASDAKQKAIEREFEISLAAVPLRPIRFPIDVIANNGESLMSILFRACNKIGIYGTQQLINKLGWKKSRILRSNEVVQAAKSIGVKPVHLANSCPITIDDKSVFFGGHRMSSRHVTAHEIRICAACFKENGYGRKEWLLRALMVCPHHRAPLIGACDKCTAPLSNTRPAYDQCRCGHFYKSEINSCTNQSAILASIIVDRFYGKDSAGNFENLGLPSEMVKDLPLSGLLDLICVLGVAERDPAIFQLRRLDWPLDAAVGIRRFYIASDALTNWPKGLFHRLRSVRMYAPWEDSPKEVTKTLDHILRAATHHMEPSAGRVLLQGIAEFVEEPREWNEHRQTAHEDSSCLA